MKMKGNDCLSTYIYRTQFGERINKICTVACIGLRTNSIENEFVRINFTKKSLFSAYCGTLNACGKLGLRS